MGGLLGRLPRGDRDGDLPWGRRHDVLIGVLAVSAPLVLVVGLLADATVPALVVAVGLPLAAAAAARFVPGRRAGAAVVTVGLTGTGLALVAVSGGALGASSSLFVATALLAVYGHWAPPTCAAAAAVLGDVAAVLWGLPVGAPSPWFALGQGTAMTLTCGAVVALLAVRERERDRHDHAETTSRLLLDLARRSAALPGAQQDLLRELEESERDPYVRGELERAGVLAARMRRDAESLLVLSGRLPDREAAAPAMLGDVIRAGVADTAGGDRVVVTGDGGGRVAARVVADLAHVLAELVDNALRHSPPDATVRVAVRAHGWGVGSQQIAVTDAGTGMDAAAREAANRLLDGHDAGRPDGGCGLAVVARLAARHRIGVALREGTGSGLTAVLLLPESVLVAADGDDVRDAPVRQPVPVRQPAPAVGSVPWRGSAPSPEPAGEATPTAPSPPVPATAPVAPVVRVVPMVHASTHAAARPTTHAPAHAPHAAHRRVLPAEPATLPATAPPTCPPTAPPTGPAPVVARGRHARSGRVEDDLPPTAPIGLPELTSPPAPELTTGWFDDGDAGPREVEAAAVGDGEVGSGDVEAAAVEGGEVGSGEAGVGHVGSREVDPVAVHLPVPREPDTDAREEQPEPTAGPPSSSFPHIPPQVRRSTRLIRPYTVPAPPAARDGDPDDG